jgi:Icc-related predicted phosphoesterase
MKIICISDTHNLHRELSDKLPDGDMIIHAGDISYHGTAHELQDFLDWYRDLPYRYKIFIAGNHDFAFEDAKDSLTIHPELIYLENSSIVIEGLTVWGSPLCPPHHQWAFMWDDVRRQEAYAQIPDNCDIVINHSPAYQIQDLAWNGANVGCQALAERIKVVKPRLLVCGHIHEGFGIETVNEMLCVNASYMTRRYEPLNTPVVVELVK